jgi:zinc transporter ZupT
VEPLLLGALVGVLPLAAGFLPRIVVGDRNGRWRQFSCGLALGFLALFFMDLLEDSGGLGESLGLAFSLTQVTLVASFILGYVAFAAYARGIDQTNRHPSDLLAYVVAVGIGLHSMAEGIVTGYNFAGELAIEEYSLLLQGFSFAAHKFLEGFTIAVFAPTSFRGRGFAILLGLAGLPLLLGIPLGVVMYPAILANLLFAAGAGTTLFIVSRIAVGIQQGKFTKWTGLGFTVGFLLVYIAGLIHFTEFH